MNNQKPAPGEAKQAGDQETTELSQPIDLAQRVALSSTLPSGHSSQSVTSQPVAMRAHLDPSKSALMTLYLRAPVAPRSSGPSSAQVVGPPTVMTASMASAQHFSSSKTVVRLPTTDNSQSHASVAATGSSTHLATATISTSLTQPSSSGTTRHISSTTVHPLSASSGQSTGAMASIIKGAHSVAQTVTGHMIHSIQQPYSSHVPRGPAAVANISAAPKSAVATPMLRPSHSGASATLPPSSIITSHPQMTPRSPSVVTGRTATTTPPVPKAASPVVTMTQIIDFQKNTSYVTSASQGQVGLSSRPVEVSLRTTLPHSSVTLNKPVHVSQPIVQHLQQVPEKGFIKTVVTSSSSSHPHNSMSSQQVSPAITSGSELASHSTAVTTSSVPCTSAHTSVVTLASGSQRVPLNQPPSLQTVSHSFPVTTSASVALHPTFTVVSAKGLSQTVHTVAPVAQQYSQAVTIAASPVRAAAPVHVSSLVVTTVATPVTTTAVTCIATVAAVSRPLNTTVSSSSIPVAKVYPQPLPTTSHSNLDSSAAENSRGNFYVAQPQGPVTSTVTVSTTVASMPPTVVLSESRNESGSSPVQFATIPKSGVPSGTPYAVSPAAYYYEPYSVQSAITMHPYTASPSAQGFTAAMPSSTPLRSGILPQHTSGGLANQSHTPIVTPAASPVAPVRPLNSVMVAVDPSRHVALHPAFTSSASGGKSNTEVVVSQTSAPPPTLYTVASNGNASVGLGATSLVSATYSSQQGPVSNHNSSPRPSILRKRTSDGVTAAAKKNLLASLPGSGPTSPHPEASAPTTATSPKPPQCDQLRENGSYGNTQNNELVDPNRISSHVTVTVKQEPTDASENGSTTNITNQAITPTVQVEASPRKKPRKQLLAANELIEAHSTDGEDDFDKEIKDTVKKELQKEDEDSVKWVTFCKRPAMSLLNSYRHTWKSRHNHFLRYTDVKPKEEKRPTVNDLANQKGVLQKANGWKIYHLASQMDDVIDLEDTVCARLSHLLEFVENDPPAWKKKPLNSDEDKILGKLTDLIKGNLQRSKIVQDQVAESKQQVLKVLEHKPHIMEIVSKYVSKRPLKKKEKS